MSWPLPNQYNLSVVCEGVWLRRILADLQQEIKSSPTIYCDNMSAIAMTKKEVQMSLSTPMNNLVIYSQRLSPHKILLKLVIR